MRVDSPMTAPASILIVDDEPNILLSLQFLMKKAGYDVRTAKDGEQALAEIARATPDLVLLDVMMPKLDGFTVCQRIRAEAAWQGVRVIMLTARGRDVEREKGLALGADDYITKPFRLREVGARLEAVLRRAGPKNEVVAGLNGLALNLESRTAQLGEARVELTAAEFDLLAAFLQTPGKVFSRAELLELISGYERDTLERTIDTHIKNLRRKLGEGHGLETVFGVGYRYGG